MRTDSLRGGAGVSAIRPIAVAVLVLLLVEPVRAATAAAAGGTSAGWLTRPFDAKSDSNWFWCPATANLRFMYWDAGPNTTDGTKWTHPQTSEAKFAGPPVAGKVFSGVNFTDGPGPRGSYASVSGWGSSTVPTSGRPTAKWSVWAGGILGTLPGTVPAEYTSTLTGHDPWGITSDDLLALPGSSYDLYIPFALEEGYAEFTSGQGVAAFGLDVSYSTASGSVTLLAVSVLGYDATVSIDSLATCFCIEDITMPSTDSADLLTADMLESMIEADLAEDGRIDTVLSLGLLLDDIPKPTVDMGEGVLAWVSEGLSARAEEAVLVPEPATFTLALSGLATYGAIMMHRRRTTEWTRKKKTSPLALGMSHSSRADGPHYPWIKGF